MARICKAVILAATAALVAGCGSSGGTDNPPSPPAPVTPPPQPPEPTFEERLAGLAKHDPNACREATPGFEALGGWIKNAGLKLGQSRVWVDDAGALDDMSSHGYHVWAAFTACAVRSTRAQYVSPPKYDAPSDVLADAACDSGCILSRSFAPSYDARYDEHARYPKPNPNYLMEHPSYDGKRDGERRILEIVAAGNERGKWTSHLQLDTFQALLQHEKQHEKSALIIVVGGYSREGDGYKLGKHTVVGDGSLPELGSSVCGDAAPLCLFAPWEAKRREGDDIIEASTSLATPQVSAALDAVWAVWPYMDILDLRNLAFDCADETMPEFKGVVDVKPREYMYSTGHRFTSKTHPTWGHGILSLTCLFTPNGGLQNPVTGLPISGGIIGPVAGPAAGGMVSGVDYTGRDFGYGFARPSARENFALAATAGAAANGAQRSNPRASGAIYRADGLGYAPGAFRGRLAESGRFAVDLTAAGNAIGLVTEWRSGGLLLRSGVAAQPEGVGSLTGSRAFRAPASVSAAVTAAYGKAFRHGLSAHVQADHWRTLAAHGRSLWQDARLDESRFTAALSLRAGRHEFALQGVWRSGVAGTLDVDGRSWPVSGIRERGVWLTWRRSAR